MISVLRIMLRMTLTDAEKHPVTGEIPWKIEKSYFTFADLEKAFDRVARGVVTWDIRKKGKCR